MALVKHHEKIVDLNLERDAASVDPYQYPLGIRHVAPATEPPPRLIILARKLESDPPLIGRELLLSETAQWSPAQFKELGKISPEALACLDASMPATLRYRAYSAVCPTLQEAVDEWIGLPDDRPTLQEAVLEWHRMPADDRAQASIKVKVLHFGP
jgi:hypothetical protein